MSGVLGGDDGLLGSSQSGSENNYVAALGRISGKLLSENLLRQGVDLTFRNGGSDPDILYLDVNNMRLGVNTDLIGGPVYDLDVQSYNLAPSSTIVATGTWSSAAFKRMQISKSLLPPTFGSTVLFGWQMWLPTSGATYTVAYVTTYLADPTKWDITFTSDFLSQAGTPEFSFLGAPTSGSVMHTVDINTTNYATVDNLTFTGNTIGSTVGPIVITSTDINLVIPIGLMTSDYLEFNDNQINSFSNKNIILDPNGSGTIELIADSNVTGDLQVSGNITMNGSLRTDTNIIIGDQIIDTVTINPDFTQSIIPGDNGVWSLGENTGDSSPRRWSQVWAHDLSTVITNRPNVTIVSEQMRIDGLINKISGLQFNEDILLSPDTGITYIEQTKWENNDITNLTNGGLTFASTGIGYTRFMGTNGFVVPSGTTAERPYTEVGETRWNTDLQYLECYDGTIYTVATGGGETVTQQFMEDLGFVYSVVLG